MTDLEEKAIEAKSIIQEWVDKQGHERCWYYPKLFVRLAEIFEVRCSREPYLPSLEEFREGCERYQGEEYNIEDKR